MDSTVWPDLTPSDLRSNTFRHVVIAKGSNRTFRRVSRVLLRKDPRMPCRLVKESKGKL
jgi:hypothetical protein